METIRTNKIRSTERPESGKSENFLRLENLWQPVSIETEQQLLGAILINNEAYPVVQDLIEPQHFYDWIHQQLFEICGSLIRMGKLASPVTIKPLLPADIDIGGMTVSQYLARLAAEATTVINAKDFAQVIRDLYDLRTIGEVGEQLRPRGGVDPVDAASWGVDQLDAIVSGRALSSVRAMTMPAAVARAVDAAATAYQNEGKILGMPYGLVDVDSKLLGAQKGNLIVIAARPSMGKSALALCFSRNLSKAGYAGVFYSLEMGDVELTQRMIADEIFDDGRMTYWQIRSGRFHESVFKRITEAAERLSGLPLVIEQQPGLSVSQIAARARQRKRRGKLDFMVIDHLGLIASSGRYSGSRVNEIGEMTAGLKGLAKELDCAVILLSQLNRTVEGREDKRPRLSDLRESGAIEQDADVVIMLYRKAYYLERSEPQAGTAEHVVWVTEMEGCHNELHLLIEKQRAGPVGTVKVFCDIGSNAVRDLVNHQQIGEMA
jgi:replicative DNA helicase